MRYDVIIVGAGPAGSACALRLARAGAHVCIVERTQFPRAKACGEYLSPGTVRMLRELGIADRLEKHAWPLHGVRLAGSGVSAQLAFSSPAWSLPRATLDSAILDAARDAGAALFNGRAERFVSDAGGVRAYVQTVRGETYVEGAVLVGADGAHSLVAREFGLTSQPRGNRRFAVGGHYSGLRGLSERLEMFVDGTSYFAINPFEGTRANVMLIVDERELREQRRDVDNFLREKAHALTGGRIGFEQAALEGKRIAIGPLASRARRFTAPHVLLAGDAAQFVDPFTGQGIYLALRAAQLAASAIELQLRGYVSESQAWRDYESALRAQLRRRKRLSLMVSLLVRVPIVARRAAALFERRPRTFLPLLEAVTGAT